MTVSGTESPVFTAREKSELVAALALFDRAMPSTTSVSVYRRNTSGGGQTLLAQIDGTSAAATAWTAFRSKALTLPTAKVVVGAGECVTVIANGANVSLTWRRAD